jgi:hypothetical protein
MIQGVVLQDTPTSRVVDTMAQIGLCVYPFRHVEQAQTRRLMRCHKQMSRKTATQLLGMTADLIRSEIAQELQTAVFCVYMLDGWKRPHSGRRTIGHALMYLTARFEWKESFVCLERFPDQRETGENIAKSMERLVQRMGCDDTVSQISCDSASVMAKAVHIFNLKRKLRGKKSVRVAFCQCHLTQLVYRVWSRQAKIDIAPGDC